MPPNMDHPPNLLSLPNEVLATICAQTEGREWSEIFRHPLKFLRLTCKHLYVPATKEFAKKFFTIPNVMVNTYSLQALVDICAHPIIGPYVDGVTLDAFRLGPDTYRRIQGKLEASITDGDIKSMKKHGNELQGLLEALEEDEILDDGGLAVNLLAKALKCIKTRRGEVAYLAVTSQYSNIGDGKGLGKLPNDRKTVWQNEASHLKPMSALRMLVDAAKRSGCRINQFEFDVPSYENFIELKSHIERAISTASDVFAGLESFGIHLRSAGAQRYSEDLAKILPLAKSISALELSATSLVNDKRILHAGDSLQEIANILDSVNSDTLRRVKLEGFICEQDDLRRFLDRHNSTIKELSFSNLVMAGSWDELLEWIGANLHLEKLELKALGTIDENASNDENGGDFPVKWACPEVLQGEEQVRLGLMEILEQKRSADDKRLHDEEEGEREEFEEIEEIEEVEDEIPV